MPQNKCDIHSNNRHADIALFKKTRVPHVFPSQCTESVLTSWNGGQYVWCQRQTEWHLIFPHHTADIMIKNMLVFSHGTKNRRLFTLSDSFMLVRLYVLAYMLTAFWLGGKWKGGMSGYFFMLALWLNTSKAAAKVIIIVMIVICTTPIWYEFYTHVHDRKWFRTFALPWFFTPNETHCGYRWLY